MAITAQMILMPGQKVAKTLASLEGKVESCLIGITRDAELDIKLPDWCIARSCSGRFDEWRNSRLSGQTLIINPDEEVDGEIEVDGGTFRVFVMDEHVISKEVRIVDRRDGKFVNPVYECFDTKETPPLTSVFIKPSKPPNLLDLVNKWGKDEPTACEVDYYKAFELLKEGDQKGFVKQAEYFLFRCGEKHKSSMIMTRYYLASVLLMLGEGSKAAGQFLLGLGEAPRLAEFWCGLGDCLYKSGQPEKAARMYKNAMFMGKRRDPGDELPITLPLYDAYPQTMIKKCLKR